MASAGRAQPEAWKGITAGLAGGAAGALAMTALHMIWHRCQASGSKRSAGDLGRLGQPPGGHIASSRRRDALESALRPVADTHGDGSEAPAGARAATAVLRNVLQRERSPRQEPPTSDVVHYAMGSGLGLLYGVGAELYPAITTGVGLGFGAGLALFVEEAAVPALRLSEPAGRSRRTRRLFSVASHVVYGVACEAVRRRVRAAFG